ncbi:MAG: hypothetical protein R3B06_10900 [Kofleriaceae bacterium]
MRARPAGARAVNRGVAVVAAVLLAHVGDAAAIDRDCPPGQAWSPNLGACMAARVTVAASPEDRYYRASAQLDSGRPGAATAAARSLAATCGARHGPSCTLLGFVLEHGRAGPPRPADAAARYQRGCDLGDVDGCLALSSLYAVGLLGEPEPARAIPPLARACELGSGKGCYVLAGKYDRALGVGHDPAQAATLFARAVTRLTAECPGSGPSCYALGTAYRDGHGAAVDPLAAAAAFATGCDGGTGAACFALGQLHRDGRLGQIDAARALDYFDRSCQRYDNAEGCHAAGEVLAEQADAEPARLTALAARACQLATAQCDLTAYMFATGKGGVRDEVRATAAYVAACQAGNATACSAAAARIAHGTGTVADGGLAVRIWTRACETGSGADCYQAARAHADGELVARDPVRAQALLELGCVRASAAACEDAALAHLDHAPPDPVAAARLYQAGCALGRGETCTQWGDALATGRLGPDAPTAALDAYRRGCQAPQADAEACASWADASDQPTDQLAAARRACQLGDGDACGTLDARAAAVDDADARAAAMATLTDACAASPPGDGACGALAAELLQGGALASAQPSRGHAIAVDACRRGARSACLIAADDLATGAGVVADLAEARARYADLCDHDVPVACLRLGGLLADDDRPADGARLFARACADGLPSACTSLGFAHYTGQGAPWDVGQARALYRAACDDGDEFACTNLGDLIELGVGAPPDPAAARPLYQAACTDGAVAGCADLADLLAVGTASERRQAASLYQRACDAADPAGCRGAALAATDRATRARAGLRAFDLAQAQAGQNPYVAYVLGTLHADGIGTPRDPAAALAWFDRGCVGRDPHACLAAGAAHAARGDGPSAVAAYDRACAAGVDRACQLAAATERRLPRLRRGCGCDGGPAPGGPSAVLTLAVLAAITRRQRRRPTPR